EGVTGRITGALGTFVEDQAHRIRIAFVLHGPLLDRAQFSADGVDHRLLAVQTADAGAAATLIDPVVGGLIGIHQVQLIDRALVRITRIGAPHTGRIGRHATYLLAHLVGGVA